MSIQASLFPCLIGLTTSTLILAGCNGDDSAAEGGSTTDAMTSSNATTPNTTTSATTNPGTSNPTQGPGTASAGSSDSQTAGSATESGGSAGTADGGDTTGADSSSGEPPAECPYDEVQGMPDVTLEMVAEGFDRPLLALGHPTEPERLFVVEQGGNVRILEPGETEAPDSAFLTVDVENANANFIGPETGLLGFAFHPDFPTDPRVYVNYNPDVSSGNRRTIVSEFTVDPGNPDQVDPDSERIIFQLRQPAGNHNGGMILFDQDGYLIVAMGDGGGGGDPYNTGRDTELLLAKMLRIGVEPDGTPDNPLSCEGCPQYGDFDYTIPADNPFVGRSDFAPEIYAWGVRNPWRFSQDAETGLIYAADVGQNSWEEVSIVAPGADLGWSDMEGFHCHGGASCNPGEPNSVNGQGITMPLIEYSIGPGSNRCSITGGGVYRSCQVPAWDGVYFYGDFCTGELFGLVWDGTSVTEMDVVYNQSEQILGNGWNAYGDVFITTVETFAGTMIADGRVYRVAPEGA